LYEDFREIMRNTKGNFNSEIFYHFQIQ
jgi:hypothetical protein